jgi:biopolymer transport protein ExbD
MTAHAMRRTRRPYPAYRANAYAASASKPMMEMNTTPLIDVLLVLLVMLILAVPIATHQTQVDLPQDGNSVSRVEQVSLTVDAAGQPYWNGMAVDTATLRQRLATVAAQAEQPVVRFQPDPQASYDAVVHVIAMTGEERIENLAFIGNEQFRTFGK